MHTDAGMFYGSSNTMGGISVGDIFFEMVNNFFANILFCKKLNLASIYTAVEFLENPVIKLQKVICVCNSESGSRLK